MDVENLTPKNAHLFAALSYDNPQCITSEEFVEDYKRFKYIKRLCRRYAAADRLSERLMLNHLILLTNVFGVTPTVRLLFMKCDDDKSYRVLKPFLVYLRVLPQWVRGINGRDINTDSIPLDEGLLRKLREL
jgi:hypothetical protein